MNYLDGCKKKDTDPQRVGIRLYASLNYRLKSTVVVDTSPT